MDEDILERDEVLNIMLSSMETRVEVSNSTSVVILNDDGEFVVIHNRTIHLSIRSLSVEKNMLWCVHVPLAIAKAIR